eukprot:evm.model.NODE_26867_length_7535_cov_21.253881.1
MTCREEEEKEEEEKKKKEEDGEEEEEEGGGRGGAGRKGVLRGWVSKGVNVNMFVYIYTYSYVSGNISRTSHSSSGHRFGGKEAHARGEDGDVFVSREGSIAAALKITR